MATRELTIPLLIRLMEFARESAKNDFDLHYVAEALEKEDYEYSMKDYAAIMARVPKA